MSHTFNKKNTAPVVFIAPLDWGLGHATRCIPLIQELKNRGCRVIIGGGGPTRELLEQEFPGETFVYLPPYGIKYSRNKRMLMVRLLLQFPKVLYTIFTEHRLLKKYIRRYRPDLIISDNRFGLFSRRIKSIYITHQISLVNRSGKKNRLATAVHRAIMKRFREVWIPDHEKDGLAGNMSHDHFFRQPHHYLGPLSRFHPGKEEIQYDLCICLSGPEPQRSILEERLLNGLSSYAHKVAFIRGKPGAKDAIKPPSGRVDVYNHLEAHTLNKVLNASRRVIARSGYTTIMDLAVLGKRAVLIPTPGQYEQEYLAEYLQNKQFFLKQDQQHFSIAEAVAAARTFPFKPIKQEFDLYKSVIADAVRNCHSST